jgi:hypothetical protein
VPNREFSGKISIDKLKFSADGALLAGASDSRAADWLLPARRTELSSFGLMEPLLSSSRDGSERPRLYVLDGRGIVALYQP